jgi:hypothetical protein
MEGSFFLDSIDSYVALSQTTKPRGHLSIEQNAFRTLALADAIRENTVLHTLVLSPNETDTENFQESIRPRLETNLFHPV